MNLYKSFTNNEFYGAASKLEKKTKKQNCQMNCSKIYDLSEIPGLIDSPELSTS